ncbi:MAG: hypothetical protein AAB345_03140 [Patescibacteria group bacterium]
MKGKVVRKFALSVLVAVLSFGFVGCASLFGPDESLKEEGLGEISDMREEKNDKGDSVYYVTIRYCRREAATFVTWRTYNKMWIGKSVYLKLLAASNPEKATYLWWATDGALDRALFVEFNKP